ncbi:MAG: apolipoprotein N-acyltransferase [Nitrospirae bacterium]|nr:apolipoprotein N-acyltransferase [Nitrospirota bacterium]
MIKKKDVILSLISGVLLALAFPPVDLYPLAWIALIPFLVSLDGKKVRASFKLGMLTGLVYFGGTIYWVFNSMYFYGHIPAVMSALLMLALSLYLALYVGLFSALFSHLSRRSRFPALFFAPVLWVTLEVLRTYALTGFPWSLLGYSQYKFLSVIQVADITGVYGVSFLVVAVNGAIYDVADHWPKKINQMPLFDRWPLPVGLSFLAVILLFSLSYGVWRLGKDEGGEKIRVSVIQGNFEQEQKWDISFQRQIIDTYKRLTDRVSARSPKLIVWPETAVPFVFGRDEAFTAEIVEFEKKLKAHLLFGGVLEKGLRDNQYHYSNSSILLSPEGQLISVYDKIHMVPYGEYVPLRRFFPFISKLVEGIGDFTPGSEYTVMNIPGGRFSTLICYEIIFPDMARKFAEKGADFLVTITNDAWFGRSSAPYQHFSIAVLRAVENRMPVVRSANTGISGFIDAKGRIMSKSGLFVEDALTEEITIRSLSRSFYSKYGDLFAFLCIISCVLLIANNVYTEKH